MVGLRRDGSEFPAEVTLSGLPMGSGMLVTTAIRDVSERLAMEAERERLRAAAEQERFAGGCGRSSGWRASASSSAGWRTTSTTCST